MKNKRILFSVLLAIFFLLFNRIDAGEKKKTKRPPMPPALVVVEQVKMINKTTAKEYIGNIEAIEEVDIQPRISGFITDIKFKEGSLVKKGDLLFAIEDTTYKAKALAAKASLDQANAELEYAESNYKRKKILADKNAVAKATLEDADRLVKFHRAKCEHEKASLLDAENELSYTKISAPITGCIGQVNQTRGNYVSLNSPPLVKIVSMDPIQVKFSISERVYQNLFKTYKNQDNHLDFSIKLSNGVLYPEKGKIAFVDNVVDNNTGTISVWVEFPNPKMALIPGGYVCALVSENDTKPLPGVTVSGIITDHKGNFVYVLGPKNVPVRRNVKLGNMVGNYYTILKGLKEGEVVIVDGTHKVMPGMPVKPLPVEGSGKTPNSK
jgi:RND family efflux transporter MFP subunit